MKILSPIGTSEDIEILNPVKYDTEFFFGYLPDWWVEKYNKGIGLKGDIRVLSTPLNNRNDIKANVRDKNEVSKMIQLANNKSTKLFLVINAKYYPDYVYDDLRRYLDEIYEMGIRHVICCDLGLIKKIEELYPDMKVSVSCLNQVSNSSGVEFYKKIRNVDRIVFPRHMSSEEIMKIAEAHKELEFEYFIFSNKCIYDDGYCRGLHAFHPVCKDSYESKFYNCKLNKEILGLRTVGEEFWSWTQNEKNADENKYCTPNFACTACSLIKLVKIQNISTVKMSIRGHDVEERLRQVQMARMAIECAENEDLEGIKKAVSKMYGKDDLCGQGMSCMMK